MEKVYYILILSIVIGGFVFEKFVSFLNSTWYNKPVPMELDDLYDKEEYNKSMRYKKVNFKFSLISSIFSFILLLIMILWEGFAWLNDNVSQWANSEILVSLLFLALLGLASDILGIPFDLYHTFVIEEKFGFNKMTKKLFWIDKLKSWLLSAILGGGILLVILYIYNVLKTDFWWITWLFISAFSLFMSMFYSQLIVPLFNKQTALEEGRLKDRIESFCKKIGFQLNNVYVIDGSRRSSKANAYFTGLGKKKRIVLYDTLIKDLNEDEILAVLAHEMGHYKHKHTLFGIIQSIASVGLMLFIFSLFMEDDALAQAFGVEKANFHISILAFGILYTPLSLLMGIVFNVLSRKNEYQADQFTAENDLGDALISGLKALSKNNLSNLTPHPFFVFMNYSHPSLIQRIRAIKKS